jgi:hypothetical protein
MSSRLLVGAAFVIGCSALTACGGSWITPSGSGATINGSITSLTPSSVAIDTPVSGPADATADGDGSPAGLTVSVVGSSTQVTVDGSNRFTLEHVPGGDVVLRFQGPGLNSTVTVPAVQDGQTITIAVSVKNGLAELDSDDRSSTSGSLEPLEGRIDSLPPVAAAGTFVIDGTIVETNGKTTFTTGGASATFTDLALGIRVHVAGTADGAKLLATSVDIQNTNATLPVIVNGTVAGLTGTAASFQFTVDGTLVKGNATTTFTGNSAFADLANGSRVEVKGEPGNAFVLATSIHVNPQ